MLPEEAIEIIEYARAFNKEHTQWISALDMAIELLKKEQMKSEHEESKDNFEIVRCKNCDMWCEDNNIVKGNTKPCAQWSGEGYTVFTNKNDFCSYGVFAWAEMPKYKGGNKNG